MLFAVVANLEVGPVLASFDGYSPLDDVPFRHRYLVLQVENRLFESGFAREWRGAENYLFGTVGKVNIKPDDQSVKADVAFSAFELIRSHKVKLLRFNAFKVESFQGFDCGGYYCWIDGIYDRLGHDPLDDGGHIDVVYILPKHDLFVIVIVVLDHRTS